MKQLSVVLFSIFFFCINLNASEIENIINHFKKIENISFSFKQNINEKILILDLLNLNFKVTKISFLSRKYLVF